MKNRTIKAGRLFIPQNGIRAGVTVFLDAARRMRCGRQHAGHAAGDIPLDFGVSVDHIRQPCGRDYCFQPFLHGVYAYYTGSSNLSTSDKPNFMCNQKVERTNSASPWTYSPVKYWYQ